MSEEERETIFKVYSFQEDFTDGSMYMPIKDNLSIVWDDAYQYWFIETAKGELKIYPRNKNDIDKLIGLLIK